MKGAENGDRPRGVFPLKVDAPEKASQTLLAKISDCPYSGALYLKHRDDGAQSHEMARGEACHALAELMTNMLIEEDEISVPPEVAKDHMQAILDERTDLAMSPADHDACRVFAWNWARNTVIDPAAIVGVEIMLELELGGWKIRGKLDRAEIANGEGFVRDYKSSLYFPDQESHENDFQQQFYGLLLAEGVPEGETVPLGRGLSGIHEIAEFPRITDDDGKHFKRHAYKDQAQIHDFKRTVESALTKLNHGLETGEWKASPGLPWCDRCPARRECPLPAEALPPEPPATEGQAQEVAGRTLLLERELSDLRGAAKSYVEQHAIAIEIGDRVFNLYPETKEDWRRKPSKKHQGSKEQVKQILREEGYDPDEYWKTVPSTRFKHKAKEAA